MSEPTSEFFIQVYLTREQYYWVRRNYKSLGFATMAEFFRYLLGRYRGKVPKQIIVRCPLCNQPLIQTRWRGRVLKCTNCGAIYVLQRVAGGVK